MGNPQGEIRMTNRNMNLKQARQTTPAPEVSDGPSIVIDATGSTLVYCSNHAEMQAWADSQEITLVLVDVQVGPLARSHSLNTYEVIA
jgi:hypothetical protein